MREHKTAATTAGILYITGTAAGVVSVIVSSPFVMRVIRWPMPWSTRAQW